ncbi:sporulation protein YunB [Chakrabartyella piscis]|uniref:sporulation protein YunB n=1 Tax=Chakrabartyella piscis TaxID=2918914 RepID=UPI0029583A52|nr:sporulation protein YunB [Chakrabartyella piscis]
MKKRKPYKQKYTAPFVIFSVLVVVLSFFIFLYIFEQKMLPTLQEISYMESKVLANTMIDDGLQEILLENEWNTTEFLLVSQGDYTNYSANTAAINLFCSQLCQNINEDLYDLAEIEVYIPIGAITDISMFSNLGPEILFTLLPSGSVSSDYETAFESAGINQLHYKLWITLHMEFKVVNPLYQETIAMERNIMLVDTIIGGKVPENHLVFSD